MKVLVVGAGRMGQRHLRGLAGAVAHIDVVDPRADSAEVAAAAGETRFALHRDLETALAAGPHDAAILAATAAGRLSMFQAVAAAGTPAILVEKPIEQSRRATRAILDAAEAGGAQVRFNHYRRSLEAYRPLREMEGPKIVTVTSGAMGLGCNGIHWIDFAVWLTGAATGRLLFGEIEPTRIGSGRGAGFRDYGGRGVFALGEDGSRLVISCAAASSAPTVMSIIAPAAHWVIDQQTDRAILHRRPAGLDHANYLYGKDYESPAREGLESADLIDMTRRWIGAVQAGTEPPQPRAAEVRLSYDLLFDLLETAGLSDFDFT